MTEMEIRQAFVDHAKSYLGVSETGNGHKVFVDIYNKFIRTNEIKVGSLPRKSLMSVSYEWCACYASAMAIECGYGMTLIPIEMSCSKLITMAKEMGIWEEDESIVPSIGDLVIYDWDDGADFATTNDKNSPNHIGIVTKVLSSSFEVIEGNKGNKVSTRTVKINGRYLRGFIRPKFDTIAEESDVENNSTGFSVRFRVLSYGCTGDDVSHIQVMLNKLNNAGLTVDGKFGPLTKAAVINYQKKLGYTADGIVLKKVMTKICGV